MVDLFCANPDLVLDGLDDAATWNSIIAAELAAARQIAARHHERLDGSGYPHGLTGAGLTAEDRLLAAADTYHALTEPRPHRPVQSATAAAATLREEVSAGRLDADAVSAWSARTSRTECDGAEPNQRRYGSH